MHHGLEDAGSPPALGLLRHRFPRRQVVRHYPPWRTRSCNPAQAIEDFAPMLGVLRKNSILTLWTSRLPAAIIGRNNNVRLRGMPWQ